MLQGEEYAHIAVNSDTINEGMNSSVVFAADVPAVTVSAAPFPAPAQFPVDSTSLTNSDANVVLTTTISNAIDAAVHH